MSNNGQLDLNGHASKKVINFIKGKLEHNAEELSVDYLLTLVNREFGPLSKEVLAYLRKLINDLREEYLKAEPESEPEPGFEP